MNDKIRSENVIYVKLMYRIFICIGIDKCVLLTCV